MSHVEKLQIRSDLDDNTWKMLEFIKKWLNIKNNTASVKFCVKQTFSLLTTSNSISIIKQESKLIINNPEQKQLRIDLDENSVRMLEIIKNWLNTTYNTEAVKFSIKRTYELLENSKLSILND